MSADPVSGAAADAVESVARAALLDLTAESTIGAVTARRVDDDGTITLDFAATVSGYPGWHWSVTLAQLPGEEPTVLESELLPGEGALLAPDWVPWAQRLEEYRAAQAAALAAGEEIEDDLALDGDDREVDDDDLDDEDLDEDDDDEDLGDLEEEDDDFGDDPDDGIDFEPDLPADSGPAADVDVDQQGEAETESDEAGPEESESSIGGERVD